MNNKSLLQSVDHKEGMETIFYYRRLFF